MIRCFVREMDLYHLYQNFSQINSKSYVLNAYYTSVTHDGLLFFWKMIEICKKHFFF